MVIIKFILMVLSTMLSIFFLIGSLSLFFTGEILGGFFFLALTGMLASPLIIYRSAHSDKIAANRGVRRLNAENGQRLNMQGIRNRQLYDSQAPMQRQTPVYENSNNTQPLQYQNQEPTWQGGYTQNTDFYNRASNAVPAYTTPENQIAPSELLLMKIDSLSTSGIYFERVLCEILKANGYTDVETTKASNDYGIDVLAEKDGVTYAIQCKCYSSTVGNKAVQEAYTGKDFYNRMVAVVATNSTFSKSAIETAKTTRVLLWDRQKLKDMIAKADNDLLYQLIHAEL